jgi:hypothetical protein
MVRSEAVPFVCPLRRDGLIMPVIEYQIWFSEPLNPERCRVRLPPRDTCTLTTNERVTLIDAAQPVNGGMANFFFFSHSPSTRGCVRVADYVKVLDRPWVMYTFAFLGFLLVVVSIDYWTSWMRAAQEVEKAELAWIQTLL